MMELAYILDLESNDQQILRVQVPLFVKNTQATKMNDRAA